MEDSLIWGLAWWELLCIVVGSFLLVIFFCLCCCALLETPQSQEVRGPNGERLGFFQAPGLRIEKRKNPRTSKTPSNQPFSFIPRLQDVTLFSLWITVSIVTAERTWQRPCQCKRRRFQSNRPPRRPTLRTHRRSSPSIPKCRPSKRRARRARSYVVAKKSKTID